MNKSVTMDNGSSDTKDQKLPDSRLSCRHRNKNRTKSFRGKYCCNEVFANGYCKFHHEKNNEVASILHTVGFI